MNSVFNSVYEVSLRILIILYNLSKPVSADRIVGLDFLSVYGKEFDVSNQNLHGNNNFKYSELPSRKSMVDASLKQLVINGMIDVSILNGFEYTISDKGANYISNFESDYAIKYSENVVNAIEKFKDLDDSSILKEIQSKSKIKTLRKES